MPEPLFPRWATPAIRWGLLVVLLGVVVTPALMMVWVRTGWSTGVGRAPEQPIAFDHRLHAGDFRIDCRYCHETVETGASAGLPATDICVSCHQPAWLRSAAFEPVRRSLASGRPIAWRRVNALPGYVYFDHAAHTRHGVACGSCHGRVERMGRIEQAAPLTMTWCLECHQQAPRRYGAASRTACVTCHR